MLNIEQRDKCTKKYQVLRMLICPLHKNNKLSCFLTHGIVMTVRNNRDKQLE